MSTDRNSMSKYLLNLPAKKYLSSSFLHILANSDSFSTENFSKIRKKK